jgi:hypothetical protein
VTQIVVPGVPDLPPPPQATERARVCSGWILIPKGERPTCERCKERLERYRHVAAGNGTIREIREAISALEYVDRQLPLGMTVKMRVRGLDVWACPRAVPVSVDGGDPIPAIDVYPNRKARRDARRRGVGRA